MTTNHMVIRCRYDDEIGADRYDNILHFTDYIDINESIDKSLVEPEDMLYVCDVAYVSSLLEYSDDIFVVDEEKNILLFKPLAEIVRKRIPVRKLVLALSKNFDRI